MNNQTTLPDPLVSIICVNYNGGPYLLDTLRAVLDSTVPLELFLVDNGSADGSVAAARYELGHDDRLRVIESGENLGFARGNNLALERAEGEFVLLLNPDCIVQPDTLERMVEALRQDPRAGMAGCLIVNPDGSEQAGCRRTIPTPMTGLVRALHLQRFFTGRDRVGQVDLVHRPLPEEPIYVEAISGAFMLVRRQALREVGFMDDGYFLHCEDLDWCKSFEEAGWKILFVPSVKIVHHKGACSANRPLFVLWHKHRGMVRFYRKFLSRSYSLPFNLLVMGGVWLRFIAMVPVELGRLLLSRRSAPLPALPPVPSDSAAGAELPLLKALEGESVLVTGGTGFIGHRLVQELLRQGARVSVMTRAPDLAASLWPGCRVRFVHGDLEDPESLAHTCDGIGILFHLASCAHMLDVADEHARHRQVTEQGTLRLLEEARRARVRGFVFASSVKAMGEEGDQCLSEGSDPRPESTYGAAKLHAEHLVLEAGRTCAMRVSVLRLPMVYGPGNKGNLPRMIEAIRQDRFPPLPEVHNRRSMVHVDDVVQAALLVAANPSANGEIYIVTDGHAYSSAEIYRLIAANLGKRRPRWFVPLSVLKVGAWVGDQMLRLGLSPPLHSGTLRKLLGSAWYSDEKIGSQLGFRPRYDLQRALPQMIAEMVRKPVGRPSDRFSERPVLNP
jgi:nucleoside-diphosphate-sugar epimerase/GT2 family glycosyltransferase